MTLKNFRLEKERMEKQEKFKMLIIETPLLVVIEILLLILSLAGLVELVIIPCNASLAVLTITFFCFYTLSVIMLVRIRKHIKIQKANIYLEEDLKNANMIKATLWDNIIWRLSIIPALMTLNFGLVVFKKSF